MRYVIGSHVDPLGVNTTLPFWFHLPLSKQHAYMVHPGMCAVRAFNAQWFHWEWLKNRFMKAERLTGIVGEVEIRLLSYASQCLCNDTHFSQPRNV